MIQFQATSCALYELFNHFSTFWIHVCRPVWGHSEAACRQDQAARGCQLNSPAIHDLSTRNRWGWSVRSYTTGSTRRRNIMVLMTLPHTAGNISLHFCGSQGHTQRFLTGYINEVNWNQILMGKKWLKLRLRWKLTGLIEIKRFRWKSFIY